MIVIALRSENKNMEIPPQLRENYVRRRCEDLESCKTALKNNEFEKIEVIGHQMKGNGLTFGFEEIANLGAHLESAAKEKNSPSLSELMIEFSRIVTKITPSKG